jgi:hypothetical protein
MTDYIITGEQLHESNQLLNSEGWADIEARPLSEHDAEIARMAIEKMLIPLLNQCRIEELNNKKRCDEGTDNITSFQLRARQAAFERCGIWIEEIIAYQRGYDAIRSCPAPSSQSTDFANAEINDWIEGVGDITTEYEKNFIRRYGQRATDIRNEERTKILRLVESDEWQKEHDAETRNKTLDDVKKIISSNIVYSDDFELDGLTAGWVISNVYLDRDLESLRTKEQP